MKRKQLIILFCIIVVVVVVVFSAVAWFGYHLYEGKGSLLFKSTKSTNIKEYNKMLDFFGEKDNFMPDLEQLGSYQKMDFRKNTQYVLVFMSESYILDMKYEKNEYRKQLDYINQNYRFISTDINQYINRYDADEKKIVIKPEFKIANGFKYRYIDLENGMSANNEEFSPKEIMLIGNNDKTNRIQYLLFYDTDIDYYESNSELLYDMIGIDK